MKKFIVRMIGKPEAFIEAESMSIQGGAVVFANAKPEGEDAYEVFIVSLAPVAYVIGLSEGADFPER